MTAMYPWFENCKAFITPMDEPTWEAFGQKCTASTQRIGDLEWLNRHVNEWLDSARVIGDDEAMEMLEQIHKWYFEFCDWTRLIPPKHEPIESIRATAVRLHNLKKSVER